MHMYRSWLQMAYLQFIEVMSYFARRACGVLLESAFPILQPVTETPPGVIELHNMSTHVTQLLTN